MNAPCGQINAVVPTPPPSANSTCACGQFGEQPLSIPQGSNAGYLLVVVDDEGSPFDLTGAVLTLTVKNRLNAGAMISKSSTSVLQIAVNVDPTTGLAYVYFLPADTSGVPANTYTYDVWVSLPTSPAISYQIVENSPFDVTQPVF